MTHMNHFNGQRVLTTEQIARLYNVVPHSLMRSFQRHRTQFVEGTHFIALSGELLKSFKAQRPADDRLKYVSCMYIWTKEGAWQLAQMLRTETALQAYESLAQNYFEQGVGERLLKLQQVQTMPDTLPVETLHSGEQKRLQRAVRERVRQLCKNPEQRSAYFQMIYRAIKKRYHIACYRDLPRCQLQDAIRFVEHFEGVIKR